MPASPAEPSVNQARVCLLPPLILEVEFHMRLQVHAVGRRQRSGVAPGLWAASPCDFTAPSGLLSPSHGLSFHGTMECCCASPALWLVDQMTPTSRQVAQVSQQLGDPQLHSFKLRPCNRPRAVSQKENSCLQGMVGSCSQILEACPVITCTIGQNSKEHLFCHRHFRCC